MNKTRAVVKSEAVDTKAVARIGDVEITFTDVKELIAPTLTDKEALLFLKIAHSLGLNPFKREIYAIKYGQSPASFVTGYQVYLQRAEATGKLDGWEVTFDNDDAPTEATITIYRKDWQHPFRWTVYMDEFDGKQALWKTKPRFMLRKVAIAQGFRLAFPEVLAGVPYIEEEMDTATDAVQTPPALADATNNTDVEQDADASPRATDAKIEDPRIEAARRGYFKSIKGVFATDSERHQWQESVTGKASVSDWTMEDFAKAAEALSKMMAERAEQEQEQEADKSPMWDVTKTQLAAINRLCQKAGYGSVGDEKFLGAVEDIIGRRPRNITEITSTEAAKLIAGLQPPAQEELL